MSATALNLPGSRLIESSEIYINHRFFGNVSDDPLNNFIGMDQGANIALGFGFRLNDRAALSILRSTFDKEYFLAGKFALTDGLSVLIGDAQKTSPTVVGDRNSYLGQLIFTRELNDRFAVSFVPSLANPVNNNPTLALGLAGSYALEVRAGYLERLELIAEYLPVVSGYARRYPTASLGVKLKTWGHFFSLIFTNNIQTLPGGFLPGSADNNLHFGFNIVREIS
ncbi:MAG: DUF5777 family beta-barrel protein [Candidatus Margulisiibacteriota bacterium]|jgi:hypothetical protein